MQNQPSRKSPSVPREVGRTSVAQMLTHDLAVSLRKRGRGGTSGGERGVTLRLCHRLLREEPAWMHRPMQELSEQECRRVLSRVVPATRTHMRAAVELDWLFTRALGRERGSIGTVLREGEPGERTPLSPVQWQCLLTTALRGEHLPCAPALGVMLWGGVSPEEVERLRWRHIDWEHRELLVPCRREEEEAAGGAGELESKAVRRSLVREGDTRDREEVFRRVPLRPILCRWLLRTSLFRDAESPVVPRSWRRRWELLWTSAGFRRRNPDALLYTYAACHARAYQDIPGLMRELGAVGSRLFPLGEASIPVVPEAWARTFWGKPMPGDANLFR